MNGGLGAYQMLGSESISRPVGEEVEAHWVFQPDLAIDQDVKDEMHQRPYPIPHEQRPRMNQDKSQQNRHELDGVQWKHMSSRTGGKVIAKEIDWTGTPPLFLENQVVEIMV